MSETETGIQSVGERAQVTIQVLLASPAHRYSGRPKDGALPVGSLGLAPGESESRTEIALRAGLGIVGDRYFGKPAHRAASVTVMSADALAAAAADLGLESLDPLATRRNIVLDGVDVDTLRGARFALDSGFGAVEFQAGRPANPCAWMDEELAPGVFRALRGRGGMRCQPLTDGRLSVGPAVFTLLAPPS